MLRYQLFLAIGVSFLSVWYSAIQFSVDPLVLYAPVWGILLLGLYAVSNIAIGLVNFKDTPEAAAEIEQQVKEAKAEMTKRGVIKKEWATGWTGASFIINVTWLWLWLLLWIQYGTKPRFADDWFIRSAVACSNIILRDSASCIKRTELSPHSSSGTGLIVREDHAPWIPLQH